MEAIREITVIKPTVKNEVKEKLRVAAYCRVSTDSEDQINSFIAQVRYYNDYSSTSIPKGKRQKETRIIDKQRIPVS